ncbi:Inner membrane protein YbaN [Vibrio sp. B1FLJ16]|uniref:YbaN family protein n=1 Tax=Vibrio sp. B1FLJ16 TaxID=2751178 RepID=UPI0015F6E9DD|nr:YbaN family protein [Vibrio sp. B1FLJ16]CAD7808913.1 Inner membrane protein YbaN [Vibrio sp. B1FLJ16]CAE6908300.1 Inner membrane protein YbaN [Vibrio sp. B1FLJ16]
MEFTIRFKRYFFNIVGGLCIVLGIAGIVLPLLPTTPFILLASACFMRGSPKFHQWLHNHRTFGPILYNWNKNKAVDAKVKQRGTVFIALSFTFSILVAPVIWVKIVLLVMAIVLLSWFMRLPVIELVADSEENH